MIDDGTAQFQIHSAVSRLTEEGERRRRDVVNDLLQIAEAAENLSLSFRRLHPSVPWAVLAEMGRVIRRAGDDIDENLVAVTVRRDVPELSRRMPNRPRG